MTSKAPSTFSLRRRRPEISTPDISEQGVRIITHREQLPTTKGMSSGAIVDLRQIAKSLSEKPSFALASRCSGAKA
jgi:hypothetical protein